MPVSRRRKGHNKRVLRRKQMLIARANWEMKRAKAAQDEQMALLKAEMEASIKITSEAPQVAEAA